MKYIASCSFGKDSLATILLAKIHNEPLDEIIFSEVMFDEKTSGENPEHIKWIYSVAIPMLEKMGYKVNVLRAAKNYKDCFFQICGERAKAERIGKYRGFPIPYACIINDRCKIEPIRNFFKNQTEDFTQYIGIAVDEPIRLVRMHKKENKISLLEKYGYTEEMAKKLCKEYGLLSPIYETASRGGCWFCPNAKIKELKNIYIYYPELWAELKKLAETKNKVTEKFNRNYTFFEMEKIIEREIEIENMQGNLF